MKVAVVSTFLGQKTSGAEMSSYYLAKYLSKKVEVFAITAKVKNRLPFKTYSLNLDKFPNIVLMIGNRLTNNFALKRITKILKKESPDVIHLQDFSLLVPTFKAAQFLKIPIVMTVRDFRHQCNLAVCATKGFFKYNCSKKKYKECLKKTLGDKSPLLEYLTPFLFNIFYSQTVQHKEYIKKVDRIISVSDFVRSSLIKSGVDNNKIDVIYVPKPDWKPTKKKFDKAKPVIFTAGLLVKAKGFHNAIKSLKIVKKKYPNAVLKIAGDGTYKEKLIDLSKKLGLENNVIFLGRIDNERMVEEYEKADVVLQTSIIPESLSRVIFEGFSMKKPVIVVDSGGNKELVGDCKEWFLVRDKFDFRELGEKIVYCFDNYNRVLKKIDKVYEFINKECSENNVVRKHLAVYKKVIK